MKKISCTIIALLLALHSPLALADDKPAISISQAADIAEKSKAVREGGDSVYVVSLTLERTSVINGKMMWLAKWSSTLPGNNPNEHEIGVQIFMDGTVKHIVKVPGGGTQGYK